MILSWFNINCFDYIIYTFLSSPIHVHIPIQQIMEEVRALRASLDAVLNPTIDGLKNELPQDYYESMCSFDR